MVKKSARKQHNATSQENEGNISKSTQETVQKKDCVLQTPTRKGLSSPKPKEVDMHLKKQNELHLVSASETNIMVNSEEYQKQGSHSPIVNIHIHVPSNSESSSASPTVQPVIHLHFDESSKISDAGSISSQKTMGEKRVQEFLFMTSTNSRNISLDLSDRSDSINSMKENNYTSPNENGISQRIDTDVDTCDLSNVSSSEISTEWNMRNVTETQVPAIRLCNVKNQKSQKPNKCSKEKSKNAKTDKDFESVFPKLQLKLKNLIKKKLQQANACSYNKVKKKANAKFKPLVQYHENNRIHRRQLRNRTSEQQIKERVAADKSKEPEIIAIDHIQEVIVSSDSDTSKQESNKEERVKGGEKLKRKSKSNRKSARKCQNLDECRTDGTRKYTTVKRNPELLKPERAKTRESRDRTCKAASKEEHLNWVKKVAFAKACELQPIVFAEKEMLVKSPVKSKKGEKLERKSKTSSRSVKSDKKAQQDDSLLSCDTPKRFSSYKQRLSREVIDAECSANATERKQGNEDEVLNSGSESNGEICNSKEAQNSKSRVETSSASVNSDEETQGNDNRFQSTDEDSLERWPVDLVNTQDLESRWEALLASGNNREETQQSDNGISCETPRKISNGCQLESTVLAEKEVLGKSPVNSKKAQDLKSKRGTTLASVNNSEETHQNDCTGSCGTPEKLSYGCQSQPTEEDVVEKSPDNEMKAQELKNKWVTAFASVNTSGKTQQNGSLVSCETPKRPSSYQHVDKRSSKEISDVESSPKDPNKRQPSEDQVSASANERNEEICTSTPNPHREENLESSHKKTFTLLAEGCNFSEILKKFREKYYKDKVKVFFPDTSRSNDENHIPQDSGGSAKESPLEESKVEDDYLNDDVNSVQTVKQKKEKEKSDKFINGGEVDENSNPPISIEEPVNCFSSLTEELPQNTHPPVAPQEGESFDETNGIAIHVPIISHSNKNHLVNEKNFNSDGKNISENKNIEKISDGIDVDESCCSSSLTGNNGTTPKNVILEEGNHLHVNEFRAIKKKLGSLPENALLKPDLEQYSDVPSSNTELESHRKELLNKCMAQYSGDNKQSEKTDSRLKTKRKGSPDRSALKKMKQSKETNVNSKTPKSSNKKVFSDEDFIPLDAAGPTKFAVAPLDKLTPYREHGAKNFKANMLYGNRVRRFNDPKSLQVYKAKQNASRNCSR